MATAEIDELMDRVDLIAHRITSLLETSLPKMKDYLDESKPLMEGLSSRAQGAQYEFHYIKMHAEELSDLADELYYAIRDQYSDKT